MPRQEPLNLTAAERDELLQAYMAGEQISVPALVEHGILPPPGSVPPAAGGAPNLDILRGRGALGPGTLPQGTRSPLANYPQARQQGEGYRDFIDRSGPELLAPVVEAGKAAAMTAAPGLAAFSLGMMPTPAGGQNAPSDATRQLQQDLKDKGYFPYKVDGIGGDKTDKANARYQADQRAAKQQEIDAALAQGKIEEGRRLTAEGERKAAEETAGAARLKQSQEGEGWLEKYGPYAGYPLGLLGAMYGKAKLGKSVASSYARTAQEADELMAGTGSNVNRRAGNVNAFYERGGADEVPFTSAPTRKPHAWQSNPAAGSATELYQPTLRAQYGPSGATAAGGALEMGGSHFLGVEPWRQELMDAQTAVEAKPTEANIQRLERAKAYLAGFETLENAGRAATGWGVVGGVKAAAGASPLARPHAGIAIAEGERGALDRLINAPPKKRKR